MPYRLTCANGHTLLVATALASGKIHCAKCQSVMVLLPEDEGGTEETTSAPNQQGERPANQAILPETRRDELSGQPVPTAAKPDAATTTEPAESQDQDQQRLGLVRIGLSCHSFKIVCYLLCLFLFICTLPLHLTAEIAARAGLPLLVVHGVITLGMVVVAPLLGVIGSIFCCWIPPRSGGRSVIILSLLLDLAAIGLFGASLWLIASELDPSGPFVSPQKASLLQLLFTILENLCTLAAWVLFMRFLRRLASYLNDTDKAQEASDLLAIGLVFFLLVPVVLLVLGLFLGILPCVGPLLFLGLLIWYIICLVRLQLRILALLRSVRQVMHLRGQT